METMGRRAFFLRIGRSCDEPCVAALEIINQTHFLKEARRLFGIAVHRLGIGQGKTGEGAGDGDIATSPFLLHFRAAVAAQGSLVTGEASLHQTYNIDMLEFFALAAVHGQELDVRSL